MLATRVLILEVMGNYRLDRQGGNPKTNRKQSYLEPSNNKFSRISKRSCSSLAKLKEATKLNGIKVDSK